MTTASNGLWGRCLFDFNGFHVMLYPIGIQNFESLRKGGYVYVDKTDKIFDLASTGKYYFLSRPRRFGKSLLVSTMEAYFQGKRELFGGLALERLEKEWKKYPVLHLDLSGASYRSKEDLDDKITKFLEKWENEYDVKRIYKTLSVRFSTIIDAVWDKTGTETVILIDEYDKPIIDNLDNPELCDYFRNTLQGFYSVLKEKDGYIKFGFLTGVSKIGKLSVFSGLNNLSDISMLPRYADICGISDNDLHSYFDDGVKELAEANSMTVGQCYERLAEMYDGYHFCRNSEGMYNPFSLLNTLKEKIFSEYWFETGTPNMLVKVMQETAFDITGLSDEEADSSLLSTVSTVFENPVPLLFQTGYLTITGYDEEFGIYRLGFPNREVKTGFLKFLFQYYIPGEQSSGATLVSKMAREIRNGRPEEMMKILEGLFARANYQIQGDAEKDFQYAMYIIFELLGEYVQTEKQTSNGRIDILMQTPKFVYIIEIKTDSSADDALRQIEDKGYDRPFAADSRRIYKIGINFSATDRRISEWKVI